MKCSRCFFTDALADDETCRRCSRNLTRAEIVDLVVIGLLYVLLCRFSYYFFTGDYVTHLWRGGLSFPVPWSDIFTHPVNLTEHPWHVLTVSWTFALVLAVPVLVGVFYRPAAAAIIALVGGYYVVAPFFFVLLALSALLAGTRVRNLLQLETALGAALLVPLLYLLSLSLGAAYGSVGYSAFLPWAAAAGLAGTLIGIVLWAAKKRDYNVKFLPWTLGAQAAAIFVMFYASVGFSKVEYEFLRRAQWSSGPTFRIPVRAADPGRETEADRERARQEFEARRARALGDFSRFVSWFPRDPETPMALFERAEICNLRPFFLGTRPDQLHAYTDRITPEALKDYRTIRADFPTTLVAVEARLRAARFYLQHAAFDNGVRELRDLIDFCDVRVPRDFRPSTASSVLQRWRNHRLSDDEETQLLYEVLQEARGEIRFLDQNSDYSGIPLILYEQIDLHDPAAPAQIEKLLKWFPDCRLADNLRLALLERGGWTPDRMKALYEQYPTGDAAARVLLLLAGACREKGDWASAENYLRRLAADFPDSPEAARAGVMLKSPRPAGKKD